MLTKLLVVGSASAVKINFAQFSDISSAFLSFLFSHVSKIFCFQNDCFMGISIICSRILVRVSLLLCVLNVLFIFQKKALDVGLGETYLFVLMIRR